MRYHVPSTLKPFVGWQFTYFRVCVVDSTEQGKGKARQQQCPDSSYRSWLSAVFSVQRNCENGQHGTNDKQQQPRHLPARSLVSTLWKARFCEPGRFLKQPHPDLAVPSAENVIPSNALVPGSRVLTSPYATGPIKGGKKQQLARHVSIVSAPSGTTDIELQNLITGHPLYPGPSAHIHPGAEYSPLISSVLSSPSLRGPV